MNKLRVVFFLFLFCLSGSLLLAQPLHDRTELEKERKKIQQELADTQKEYNQLKGQSKQALTQLAAVKRKMELQQSYINNINKELKFLEDDIYLSNLEIYRLKGQLDTLKSEYAKTIVYAYKNRSSYNYLNFIFSSKSFNDAMKRIKYLKSYHEYRESQVKTIVETKSLIEKRQAQQKERITQQSTALSSLNKEKDLLETQRKEKDEVVKTLKSQEKDLEKQIAAKKKRDNEVKNAIAAVIKRIQKEEEEKKKEIARKQAEEKARREAEEKELARKKAEEDAKKKTPTTETVGTTTPTTTTTKVEEKVETATTKPAPTTTTKSYAELNEKNIALENNFAANRGKLPWPVDNGLVSIGFGPYSIEGTLLKGDNPGLTISAPTGNTVKAVFDGDVVGTHNLGGGLVMVMVQHGKYLTAYSNLTNANVSKGDKVKTGQAIGKVGMNDEGSGGSIDFILMIDNKNVNPRQWLR